MAPGVERVSVRKQASILLYIAILIAGMVPSAHAETAQFHHKGSFLKRLLAPFRSNPLLQSSARPCGIGAPTCFSFVDTSPAAGHASLAQREVTDPSRIVYLELRTAHAGPFAHHWLETEMSAGRVTIGFGPATLPFIDAGQVSLQDIWGNTERITGMPPLPLLGLPPLNYRYARMPGDGRIIGKPIPITIAESDALVEGIRHRKFVGPYIPLFHDCRTFVCTAQAAATGRSSIPCYLLFKGYW
jgi:hypothetical protein